MSDEHAPDGRGASDDELELIGGAAIGGLGVHGPLMRFSVSSVGVRIAPRSSLLGLFGLPGFEISWDQVRTIDKLIGPFGGTHGVRVVLATRVRPSRPRGLAHLWPRVVRRLVIGVQPHEVDRLLAIAPAAIPRRPRRGLFWWR